MWWKEKFLFLCLILYHNILIGSIFSVQDSGCAELYACHMDVTGTEQSCRMRVSMM